MPHAAQRWPLAKAQGTDVLGPPLADVQQTRKVGQRFYWSKSANTQYYDLPMFGGTGEETILTYIMYLINLFITIIYWRCRQVMRRSSRYGESEHRFLCVVLCLLRP